MLSFPVQLVLPAMLNGFDAVAAAEGVLDGSSIPVLAASAVAAARLVVLGAKPSVLHVWCFVEGGQVAACVADDGDEAHVGGGGGWWLARVESVAWLAGWLAGVVNGWREGRWFCFGYVL